MASWTEKTIETDRGPMCVLSATVDLGDGRQMICEVDKQLVDQSPDFAEEELARMIALVD